jgi:hypothetical protein
MRQGLIQIRGIGHPIIWKSWRELKSKILEKYGFVKRCGLGK